MFRHEGFVPTRRHDDMFLNMVRREGLRFYRGRSVSCHPAEALLHYRKLVVSYNVKKLREDAITAQRKIA